MTPDTVLSALDPRITRMALAMARTDRDRSLDGDDFAQEARLAVWEALAGGCGDSRDGDVLTAYLMATARHAIQSIYRDHARHKRAHADVALEDAGDIAAQDETRALMARLALQEAAALLQGFEAEILALILTPDEETVRIAERPAKADALGRVSSAVRITTGVLAERLGRPQKAVQRAIRRIREVMEGADVWAT